MDKKHIATITILVKDRKTVSKEVNQILTENGHLILTRLGVNLHRYCVENCTAMITIAVEGTIKEIKDITKQLDELYGIVAKTNIMTE
jgi:metal-responsive CopG/Arc/MetJ family transcriptional regulator